MKQRVAMASKTVAKIKKNHFAYSILLVDDEAQQLQYLSMVLERGGYHIIKADSAALALKILKTASPDLILSDLNMPGIDGIEFCKEVYENDSCLGIPFMIISAIHDNFFRAQAVDAGAIDYLFKPFSPEQLLKSISDVFKRLERNNLTEVIFVKKDYSYLINNESVFRENGIIINCQSSAKEAIENIHSKKWDIIISEEKIKDMSAYDFCGYLQKDLFKIIPFIITSKDISSSVFSKGRKFGVTDFWNDSLTIYEIISKIKAIARKRNDEAFYPHGVFAKLEDLDSIAAAQKMFAKKQTGIMSLSNSFLNGHIHFKKGRIIDAYTKGYSGIEAFYVLMSMGRGGSYCILNTKEPDKGTITETAENLFIFTNKLRDEIKKVWNEPIIINKTIPYKASPQEKAFIKSADGKKNFRSIIHEIHMDGYHGFLCLEKLMNNGIIISPVQEHSLLEFSHV